MWKLFCFSVILLSFCVACNKSENHKFKIGVSQCSIDDWRSKMNAEMEREMLFHDNAILEIREQKDDNLKQIDDIQYFIDNDFDVIIVAPNESEAFTPVVKKAYEAGIPVIIFDRKIVGDTYTSYINLDNVGIGKAAAEYAHSLLGDTSPGHIIEITGLQASSPAQERHQGFVEGIANYPSLSLVSSVAGDWDYAKAYRLIDSLLNVYPETRLVYAHNDFMALGVDSLLREKGRRDIKVLGTDASPGQGLEAVRDGLIDATFIYPTEGHRILNVAFDILEGRPVEKIVNVPALTSVDKSNAEILLRQYSLLEDETDKVMMLDSLHSKLEQRHSTLSHYFNAVLVLAIVLGVFVILLALLFYRYYKLQKKLKLQNEQLIEERDKQIKLYAQLDTALSKGDDFYNRFISIIKTRFADASLNTESLAQEMNLGSAQLTRKIKALTNYTPVEILRNYRLEQARSMLLNSERNINEITFDVGFSSAAYLTKCFREHFGQTPSELRSRK